MTDNFVIPQIHVQCELVINTLHTEGRHITYNALQWSVNLHFRQEQIGENAVWISRFLVFIVLCFALNTSGFTAFVGIRIRKDKPGIQANLSIQPAITMRWESEMVFLKQKNVADETFCSL